MRSQGHNFSQLTINTPLSFLVLYEFKLLPANVCDWCISITTGDQVDAGTSSRVILCFYDVNNSMFGPLTLGNGSEGLFQRLATEIFRV